MSIDYTRHITCHADPFGGADIVISADDRDPDAGNGSHNYLLHRVGQPSIGELHFQHGPRGVDGQLTGLNDASVLAVVIDRLEGFQAGPFAHESNARALAHLRTALDILRSRSTERKARGVLGLNKQ